MNDPLFLELKQTNLVEEKVTPLIFDVISVTYGKFILDQAMSNISGRHF
jgi:hypothetical protein